MSLDRGRLGALLADEERRFREAHPGSLAWYERARRTLLGGVPMHWMVRWAGGFPLFVDRAAKVRTSPTWTGTAISISASVTPAP